MNEHVNAFIEYCQFEKRLDHKTLKAYRIDLKQFYIFIQESAKIQDLLGISHNVMSEYIKQLIILHLINMCLTLTESFHINNCINN